MFVIILAFSGTISDAAANGLLLVQKKGFGSIARITPETGASAVVCGTDCSATVLADVAPRTTLILQAESVNGVPFVRWGGACRKAKRDPLCAVRVKNYTKVKAIFRPEFPSLRVNPTLGGVIFGPDVSVVSRDGTDSTDSTVTIEGIDCGANSSGSTNGNATTTTNLCQQNYPYGMGYSLTAVPQPGYCFYQWEGPCLSDRHAPICQLDLVKNISVSGIFLERMNTDISADGCL